MRILILAPKFPFPPTDGGRIAVYEPLRRLSARGHRVTFLAFGTEAQAEELITHTGVHHAGAVAHDTKSNMLQAAFSLLSPLPYTASKYRSEKMLAAIHGALENDRYDLIQIEGTHMAHYQGAFQRRGLPVVLRLHNVETLLAQRFARTVAPPMQWLILDQARRMRTFESSACQQADLCLAITEEDAARVRAMSPDAVVDVYPAGVDLERFYPQPMSEEPGTVVFTGALDWAPNVDSVRWFHSAIWPIIERLEPEARWIVVGKSPPNDILHWPEENRKIQVTGFVEDVRPYLNKASVVVVPLRSGGGMRLKILEAMAAGKAVVSTPVGAEGIPAHDGEEIQLASSDREFGMAVSRLMRSPAKRKAIGKAAREWVQPYGWEALVNALELKYRALLEERQG